MRNILYFILIIFSISSCMTDEERRQKYNEIQKNKQNKEQLEEKYVGKIVTLSDRDYIVKRYDTDKGFYIEAPGTFIETYYMYISEKALKNLIKNSHE